MIMKVVVGSKNPVKIKAAEEAFKKVWSDKEWEVVGVEVNSGVSDQPMSDEESILGATNRAKKAMEIENADFAVGMEGGIQKISDKWFDKGWMVVVNKKGEIGIGSSVNIETPPKLMKLIEEGRELGEANDLYFKQKNSKQAGGHFGLMTNGLIDRTHGYIDGLIMALSRFLHEDLWE